MNKKQNYRIITERIYDIIKKCKPFTKIINESLLHFQLNLMENNKKIV